MVKPLARLGAYFSFPGYFARPGKERQREVFRAVPPDRLLIETDAPDQCLPDGLAQFPLHGPCPETGAVRSGDCLADPVPASGHRLNHPANLVVVYDYVAGMLGEPIQSLTARVEENFHRLFRGL